MQVTKGLAIIAITSVILTGCIRTIEIPVKTDIITICHGGDDLVSKARKIAQTQDLKVYSGGYIDNGIVYVNITIKGDGYEFVITAGEYNNQYNLDLIQKKDGDAYRSNALKSYETFKTALNKELNCPK